MVDVLLRETAKSYNFQKFCHRRGYSEETEFLVDLEMCLMWSDASPSSLDSNHLAARH